MFSWIRGRSSKWLDYSFPPKMCCCLLVEFLNFNRYCDKNTVQINKCNVVQMPKLRSPTCDDFNAAQHNTSFHGKKCVDINLLFSLNKHHLPIKLYFDNNISSFHMRKEFTPLKVNLSMHILRLKICCVLSGTSRMCESQRWVNMLNVNIELSAGEAAVELDEHSKYPGCIKCYNNRNLDNTHQQLLYLERRGGNIFQYRRRSLEETVYKNSY